LLSGDAIEAIEVFPQPLLVLENFLESSFVAIRTAVSTP